MWEDEDVTYATPTAREEEDRGAQQRGRAPWTAVAGLVLSVSVPICGWMVSLSNRVSALEVKTESLATSSQLSKVEQRIADWIEESDRARAKERRTK